jgi:ABC-type multidrug transport system fused ATPase/permease subunit
METKYFSLSSVENNRLIKIVQIIFGIVCIFVAIFWLIFNIRSMKSERTVWITIIFLLCFGFYQIWAGSGKATRFIEINSDRIRLKKTIILSPLEISSEDIQKIEVYPFNLIFLLKEKKKIVLRFSTTYVETNEKVKDKILSFAELNKINIEFVEEKI